MVAVEMRDSGTSRLGIALGIALASLATSLPAARAQDAPSPPAADSADADRQARALFEQGRVAFAEGRFRDAWEHFHNAYQLSKRPKLLYNVGQAADRLRMDREALKAFKLYLKKVPDAENRQEVEARVHAIEDRFEREAQLAPVGQQPPEELAEERSGEPISYLGDGDDETSDGDMGPDPFAEEEEAPPPAPRGDQPTRRGFYLRLAIGPGYLSDALSGASGDFTLKSPTLTSQILMGYGVLDQLVIGGGLYFGGALAPTVDSSEVSSASFKMLGVFADWYIQPEKHGWHVIAALAVAALEKTDPNVPGIGSKVASGLGILAGGGHEWRVADSWGIGAQAQLVYAPLSEDLFDHNLVTLSALFTATWY